MGEDAISVEAHIKVLLEQYSKLHPDTKLVKDRMMKTFVWRRREIAEGISTEDLLKRYPFLRTSAGVRRVMLMPTLATDRGLGWQEQ